jgi:sugar/nucleoside kinase (ribokinase family)
MTARSFVMVTPDAQRTMATFLGEAGQLSAHRLPLEPISESDFLFLEGYLWDQGTTTAALRKAIAVAKAGGTRIAFTVSDGFCVERHRADFMSLLENDVDVLFANEQELLHLFETTSFDEALLRLLEKTSTRPHVIVVVTRSAEGAIVIQGKQVELVPTTPAPNLVDTTGAGDAFAAGFLQGLCRGDSLVDCAKRGHWYAGQIVQVVGARSDHLAPFAVSLK